MMAYLVAACTACIFDAPFWGVPADYSKDATLNLPQDSQVQLERVREDPAKVRSIGNLYICQSARTCNRVRATYRVIVAYDLGVCFDAEGRLALPEPIEEIKGAH